MRRQDDGSGGDPNVVPDPVVAPNPVVPADPVVADTVVNPDEVVPDPDVTPNPIVADTVVDPDQVVPDPATTTDPVAISNPTPDSGPVQDPIQDPNAVGAIINGVVTNLDFSGEPNQVTLANPGGNALSNYFPDCQNDPSYAKSDSQYTDGSGSFVITSCDNGESSGKHCWYDYITLKIKMAGSLMLAIGPMSSW